MSVAHIPSTNPIENSGIMEEEELKFPCKLVMLVDEQETWKPVNTFSIGSVSN